MTIEELNKSYSKLTTNELLEIIDHKDDYTELAVSIALAELSKRNISEEDINQFEANKVEDAKEFTRKNIEDDLTLLQKQLFYIFWFPLLTFAFKQNFRDEGYVLKLKQANYYSWSGFLFFILSGVIPAFFDLSTLSSIAIWFLGFPLFYLFDERVNRQHQISKLKRMYNNTDITPEK